MTITKKDISQMSTKEGIFSLRHFAVKIQMCAKMAHEAADLFEAGKTHQATRKLEEFEEMLDSLGELR